MYNDVCVTSDNYASTGIAKEFSGRDKLLQEGSRFLLVLVSPSFVKNLEKLSE